MSLLYPALSFSQTAQPDPSPGSASTPVQSATAPRAQIRTGAELVVLDVVVQDGAGHSVHNLPREAFRVTEDKTPQTVTAFEEHSNANPPRPGPELPKLPPGTFTDYTPVPAGGALNILLIDALNTPMPDQAFLRNQLKDYVNKAAPGMRVAIFGLNTRLFMLQGFTSNLDTLKDAVNHKLIPRASNFMDDPLTGASDTSMSESAAAAGLSDVASNLQQFEAMDQSYKLQMRLQYTLDAFNSLAHYLSAFPGRKNLLWFSGSFPIDIFPDATLDNPFSVMQVNDQEFRETTSLLARSQIAVYPIDARGLMVDPTLNASQSGAKYARNPSSLSTDLMKASTALASEHLTMEQMATDTGGHAFYNTNGLAAAAAAALESGANYYTLAYTPTRHGSAYRGIHVELSGPQAAAGLKLSYRHGYYADDPAQSTRPTPALAQKPGKDTPATAAKTSSAPSSPGAPAQPAPAQTAAEAYARAAMFHGAPTPEDLLFKVRVLPVSTTTDASLTPEDGPNPASPFKGPYRRYAIDFAALGNEVQLASQPNGNHTGALEFKTFVYDSDGKLLNVADKIVQLNLKPETFQQFVRSGVGMHLQISAPARSEAYLRIAVHDVSSNRFGVVEIPTALVSRLAPLPPAPAPSTSTPATPPPPPSTPQQPN